MNAHNRNVQFAPVFVIFNPKKMEQNPGGSLCLCSYQYKIRKDHHLAWVQASMGNSKDYNSVQTTHGPTDTASLLAKAFASLDLTSILDNGRIMGGGLQTSLNKSGNLETRHLRPTHCSWGKYISKFVDSMELFILPISKDVVEASSQTHQFPLIEIVSHLLR